MFNWSYFYFLRSGDTTECPATCSILAPDTPPPSPPEVPTVKLTREQLQPPTPSVFLENKKHAFSPQLQEFCLKHPIAVVRQMASALKLGKRKSDENFFLNNFCPTTIKSHDETVVLLFPSVGRAILMQLCSLNNLLSVVKRSYPFCNIYLLKSFHEVCKKFIKRKQENYGKFSKIEQ